MQIYKELQFAFDHFNSRLFNGECQPCLITLQRQANTMGYMSYNRFAKMDNSEYLHELALNPEFFGIKPIIEIFQTMVHEMCHLVIWQRGQDTRKTYHNAYWADLMESVGLNPSDTGRKGGKRVGQKMADYPQPNGLFVIACNDLFTRGKIVEWYDIHFPKQASTERIFSDRNFIDTLLNDGSTNPDLLIVPVIENDTLPAMVSNGQELPNSALVNVYGAAPAVNTVSNKQGSKIKFSCPCGQNLWGKPTLEITCKKCNQDFVLS